MSNVIGGLFQCYVSCGSLNRSMPNVDAGARTPLASVFSALLLVLIALTAPLLSQIPTAGIAGLLLLIAWSLLDTPGWQRLWHASRGDFAIAAPDRSMVVVADAAAPWPECPQLKMLRMEGEVYFGAVPWVSEQLRDLRTAPGVQRHLLVMVKSMNFIDVAAADMWHHEMTARRQAGGDLYFHRPRPQVLQMWARPGFVQARGDCQHLSAARPGHLFPLHRAAVRGVPKPAAAKG